MAEHFGVKRINIPKIVSTTQSLFKLCIHLKRRKAKVGYKFSVKLFCEAKDVYSCSFPISY